MKHFFYAFIIAMTLASCGTDSRHFKIDGRLLNINQGEFYVYSPDGALPGLDTVKVQAGRFTKEIACDRPTTLMLVFPNFTEQPIFAQPGKTVDVKGDAYHLKELTVEGTKDNKLMNSFRRQTANASPPEALKYARQFILDHPESPVSVWMVRRYFIATPSPDYAAARSLIATMLKAVCNAPSASLRRSVPATSCLASPPPTLMVAPFPTPPCAKLHTPWCVRGLRGVTKASTSCASSCSSARIPKARSPSSASASTPTKPPSAAC